jgi:hypothetical protein
VTLSSSLLVAKKTEGSLTAREAALLAVSQQLGCASSSFINGCHTVILVIYAGPDGRVLTLSFRRDPSELEPPPPAQKW